MQHEKDKIIDDLRKDLMRQSEQMEHMRTVSSHLGTNKLSDEDAEAKSLIETLRSENNQLKDMLSNKHD